MFVCGCVFVCESLLFRLFDSCAVTLVCELFVCCVHLCVIRVIVCAFAGVPCV